MSVEGAGANVRTNSGVVPEQPPEYTGSYLRTENPIRVTRFPNLDRASPTMKSRGQLQSRKNGHCGDLLCYREANEGLPVRDPRF